MVRIALIAREQKRRKLVDKYRDKREQLKKDGDYMALQKLPRNSCKTRLRNRCFMTGRPRGYIRAFDMSRISFREQARKGNIPGIKKSSW